MMLGRPPPVSEKNCLPWSTETACRRWRAWGWFNGSILPLVSPADSTGGRTYARARGEPGFTGPVGRLLAIGVRLYSPNQAPYNMVESELIR